MSEEKEMPSQEPLPTSPDDLFKTLQAIDIKYEVYHHDPIFTVEEGVHLKENIAGIHCRNLFLRDKKKRMYLVVAANETKIDLKKLPALIESGRLSFGSADHLWQHLGIRPGSVCPFCLINDKDHQVKVILDKYMMAGDVVNYHPLDNAMTISLSPDDLLKFLGHTGHEPDIIDFSSLVSNH